MLVPGRTLLNAASRRGRPLGAYERVERLLCLANATMPVPAPHRLMRHAAEIWRWKRSPAGVLVAGARLVPRTPALVDDERTVSFAELDARTDAIAEAWREVGVGVDHHVGLLALNRIAFLEGMFAAHKLGADIVFLNTAFAAPQLADVVDSHGIDVLVHDRCLADVARSVPVEHRFDEVALREAASTPARRPPAPPARPSRVVVLTSGTTGRPKGASRAEGDPLDAASILSCVPIVTGDTAVVAAPLFHALGLFSASLSLALRSTVVLDPAFDAERTLALVAEHAARVLVVVPTMLQRILALPRHVQERYDTSTLAVVLCGGAALPGDLAAAWLDRFGENLFNVYGSTEVGFATVAAPADLRAAPGTAGRAVPGITVEVVDDEGRRVPPGTSGRILVGSALRFDGYVDGAQANDVAGLLATGDLGRFDRSGRLFVEGRVDDMIVSGGENLFPSEVEALLGTHPGVAECAVIGVPDEEFGQRLRAFVVRRPDASVSGDELRTHVRERSARFKSPREVVFLDELPRTATGKVLRRVLLDHGEVAAGSDEEKVASGR